MKKLMFLVPAAALALASCSNDESISTSAAVNGDALAIRPVMQNTRGISFTNANFKEFKLDIKGDFKKDANGTATYATEDLLGMTVTKQDDETWKITSPAGSYYWAGKNTQGEFSAYAPTTGFTPSTAYTVPSENVLSSSDATAKVEEATGKVQQDVIVAYNKGCYNDFQTGVPLHFRHVMSSIQIKADNKDDQSITIKVKNVKLCRINSLNTLKMPVVSTATGFSWDNYNPWPTTANTAITYYGKDDDAAITLSNGTAQDITFGNPFLLLPQQLAGVNDLETGAYLSVLIQVTGKDTEGKTIAIYPKLQDDATTATKGTVGQEITASTNQGYAWAAIPLTTLWKPGYKYIYTLHYSKDGIGKVDKDQNGGGTKDPSDPTPNNSNDDDQDPKDPKPGDDILDSPQLLTFDVQVIDWEEATPEERTM